MVGSRIGEDRFIRWIIVNELAPGNLLVEMWKGYLMESNDPYNYNFVEAIQYDAS